MDRQQGIDQLQREHRTLAGVLRGLTPDQIDAAPVFDAWTVKDIIAHIAAWHWALVEAIDGVLAGRAPWFVNAAPDAFNRREVAWRREMPTAEVLAEWQTAFDALIRRLERLSDEEWQRATPVTWGDGQPVTVRSLFAYEYEGAGHEGGHARQIVAWTSG